MYTLRNSKTGATTICKDKAHAKRILRTIVKNYGGREALKGIYIDVKGERDPHYAVDWKL